ncbi:MAG: hypothetical protein ABIJ97_06750 [Bacteroidota bacterium]
MKKYLFISLIIFFCLSCKKNKDITPPEIIISLPVNDQLISAIDTFQIEGNISDNKQLLSISVVLLDYNQKQVSDIHYIEPTENPFKLETQFIINNIYLETETYFLQITADDGINLSKKFIELNLTEIQKELISIYTFCQSSTNQITAFEVNKSGIISQVLMLDDDFNDAVVNSYSKQISVQYKSGVINTYSIDDYNLVWQINDYHLSQLEFQGKLNVIQEFTYASNSLGKITAYDNNGSIRKVATSGSENHFPSKFIHHYDYLFVSDKPKSSISEKIEKLNFTTGFYSDSQELDFNLVDIHAYDNDHVMLCGNKNNVAKICTYSANYNIIYQLNNFPDDEYLCSEKISESDYIFAIGSTTCMYNSTNNILSEIPSINNVDMIKYDETEKFIYFIDSNVVRIYSYPQINLINELTFTDKIIELDFLYNK